MALLNFLLMLGLKAGGGWYHVKPVPYQPAVSAEGQLTRATPVSMLQNDTLPSIS
jgi:hypothetical protein